MNELRGGDGSLTNADLAPVPVDRRTWTRWNIAALLLAVLPNLPGFLSQIGAATGVPQFFILLYPQAWFTGFALAFGLYLLFRRISPVPINK